MFNHKISHIIILITILLSLTSPTHAGRRPSFSPNLHMTTDIVLVEQPDLTTGNVTILKTLKGNLKPQTTINIPDLANFQPEYKEAFGNSKPYFKTSNKRMILYLQDRNRQVYQNFLNTVKRNPQYHEAQVKLAETQGQWRGSNSMWQSHIKYATIWIEEGKTYCFRQVMNPGPSVLTHYDFDEAEILNQLQEHQSNQPYFSDVIEIKDLQTKTNQLLDWIKRNPSADTLGIKELETCGQHALQPLDQMLDSEIKSRPYDYRSVIRTYKKIAGDKAYPRLYNLFKQEMDYWTTQADQDIQAEIKSGRAKGIHPDNAIDKSFYRLKYLLFSLHNYETKELLRNVMELWILFEAHPEYFNENRYKKGLFEDLHDYLSSEYRKDNKAAWFAFANHLKSLKSHRAFGVYTPTTDIGSSISITLHDDMTASLFANCNVVKRNKPRDYNFTTQSLINGISLNNFSWDTTRVYIPHIPESDPIFQTEEYKRFKAWSPHRAEWMQFCQATMTTPSRNVELNQPRITAFIFTTKDYDNDAYSIYAFFKAIPN
ncbi:hypothetical protein JD969_19370 [Planctomycetota bacterium]|nr:hypothetical protein JD969_19370 [Planctomycetota bacterium]